MKKSKGSWTKIISPRRRIFEINFREIWEYRDLLLLFVRRDIVTKYKQTILGPLWFIIQPVLTTIMYLLVFGRIANIPTDNTPPVLFYLSGIVAWSYFSICLNSTSGTFLLNAGIFGKVYFPRLIVPISVVISNLIQFLIQFALLISVMVFYYVKNGITYNLNANLWLFPVLVLMLALLGLGFGIIISSLTTKYRDLVNFMGFAVQLWMYATPIIYPLSIIPGKLQKIILINPVTPIIVFFRHILLGTEALQWSSLFYSFVMTLIIIFTGIIMFNRIEKSFMDTV